MSMGIGICHGGPIFARWGPIRFRNLTEKPFILVRLKDGAVASSWEVGRGKIHTFRTPEIALDFLRSYKAPRKLNGNAAIVQLWREDYNTNTVLRSSNDFVEDKKLSDKLKVPFYHYKSPEYIKEELASAIEY